MRIPKTKLEAALFVGIFIYLGLILHNGFVVGVSTGHSWMMSDWLINYHSGFVRRGLFGELTTTFSEPLYLILAFQTFCYAVIVAFYFLSLKKLNFPREFVFVALTPMLFLFPILGVSGGYRKEIIALSLIAVNCWSKISVSDENRRVLVYLMSLAIWPFLILSHEMLAVCLLIIIILNLDIPLNKYRLVAVIFLISLSILCFILALQFSRISATDLIEICEPLKDFCDMDPALNGAISWLQKSTGEGFNLVVDTHFNALFLARYCISLLLIFPLLYLTYDSFREAAADYRSKLLFSVFTLGLLVLHFFAIDYGRFLHIWLFCYIFIAMSGAQASKQVCLSFEIKHLVLLVYLPVWHLHHVSTLDISPLLCTLFCY